MFCRQLRHVITQKGNAYLISNMEVRDPILSFRHSSEIVTDVPSAKALIDDEVLQEGQRYKVA